MKKPVAAKRHTRSAPRGASNFRIWNEDCIKGAAAHLADNSVDLLICDPPYGIKGDKLDKHYNRDESNVVPGYVEVPLSAYDQFTYDWMAQAARVLRPHGSFYLISGWTNLAAVLNAASRLGLTTVNHIIWQFNFGVYTSQKYVSSHYHILLFTKKKARGQKAKPFTFNSKVRFANSKESYHDRQDVWFIRREYKPGQVKNKNQLPTSLLEKMISYSSNPGDVVCDFFLGGFTTARVAQQMGREPVGFELNKAAYTHFLRVLKDESP
jgi:site-specific DNA-methyltransferase (adenine-specific)